MSAVRHKFTQLSTPKDLDLQKHRCDNLISYRLILRDYIKRRKILFFIRVQNFVVFVYPCLYINSSTI